MPQPIWNSEQLFERQRCMQAMDLIPLSWAGAFTTDGGTPSTIVTFTADQAYYIFAVAMSLSISPIAGSPTQLAWSKGAAPTIYGGLTNTPSSTLIAGIHTETGGVSLSPVFGYFRFDPYGIYVPRDSQLLLQLANSVIGNTARVVTTLYATPTFVG